MRLTWSCLVAVCCLLLVGPARAAAQGVGTSLREGDSAMARGEYTAAIRLYSSAIATDPKAAILHTKRAAAHSGLGEHKAALRDLDAAVELDSSLVQGYLHRGRLLRSTCNFARAANDFNTILQLKPGHKAASTELAQISRAQQALQAARQAKESASKDVLRSHLAAVFDATPECGEAKMMEAGLLFAEQDYGGVAALTGHLLKGEPGNVEALFLRGRAYFYLNDQDLAKRHFAEALKYDPEHQPSKGEFRKVKNLLKRKSQAEAAEGAGRWAEAEAGYMEALGADQAATIINTALWLGLCRVRYQLKKPTEAVEACQQTLALQADLVEAIVLKVKALIMAEDYDGALREAQAALEHHRSDRQVVEAFRLAERAQKMAARKDYYKALGVARTAGERDIKRAYRDLAKRYHPDKAMTEGLTAEEANAKFADIAEAYEILSDEEKRGAYDRGEDIQPQGHPGHGFPGGGFPGGFGFPGGQTQYTFHFG